MLKSDMFKSNDKPSRCVYVSEKRWPVKASTDDPSNLALNCEPMVNPGKFNRLPPLSGYDINCQTECTDSLYPSADLV